MKNFWKKIMPAMVLAMALCVGALALTGCGEKEMVFKGSAPSMGGATTDIVLTLKTDGTAVCDVTLPGLSEENQLQTMFDMTGTYKLEDNVYTVELASAPIEGVSLFKMTLKSKYDESTKKYSFDYSLTGTETTLKATLEQQ